MVSRVAELTMWSSPSALLFVTIISVAFFKVYLLLVKRRKFVQSLSHIPGPKPLPIFGNVLDLRGGQKELIKNLIAIHKKYPKGWYKIWLGKYPVVFIQRAELAQAILTCKKNIDKDFLLYPFLDAAVGSGLVTSPGEKWRQRRKMLTPAFHFTILEEFPEIIFNKSNILVQKLEENLDKSEGFNMVPYAKRCTLDIICKTTMGLEMNSQFEEHSLYLEAAEKLSEIIVNRAYSPLLYSDFIFKRTKAGKDQDKYVEIINGYGMKAISRRKKDIGNSFSFLANEELVRNRKIRKDSLKMGDGRPKLALLDLLIAMSKEPENNLDDGGILEEINTFIFAGHDTTSHACSWTLFLLGHRPEIQEEIVKELNGAVPNFDEEGISMSQLSDLKLLERCIKETMRIYPIAPVFSRRITHQLDTEYGPLVPGTTVTMSPYLLHRDERFFPNPEKFDPDRFLPENIQGRHPFSYIPFSAGLRNCIGMRLAMMEIKIIVANVLKKFVVTSLETAETIDLIMDIILTSSTGIKLKITERKY